MTTITLTKEQMYNLCNGLSITIEPPKPQIEKWEPKPGPFYVGVRGDVIQSIDPDKEILDFGLYYPTEQQAEKARDSMRVHNRLLVWLSENDDGWVADWDDENQSKYYLYYSTDIKMWKISSHSYHKNLINIYMSYENAKKLCDLLNKGLVEA